MRRYYVDGEVVTHLKTQHRDHELSLDVQLLLDPNKVEVELAKIDSGKTRKITKEESQKGWWYFMKLHGGGHQGRFLDFYFGRNSLFCKREGEIYEKLLSDRPSTVSTKNKPWIDLRIDSTITQIGKIQVNPYCQIWREDQKRFEQLKKRFSLRFIFNYKKYAHQLSYSFCLIEWAHRHPDRFDPAIQPIVQYFRDFYLKSKFPIKRAYQYTIEQRLDDWAESEAAGGKMYIAIQYDNQQSLENYLPLLSPETRYPCDPSDGPETIRSLPPLYGNRGNKIAYQVITSLWKAGFAVNRKIVLPENLLFLEVDVPLSIEPLGRLLRGDYLVRDLTNLKEKIESLKYDESDITDRETTTGRCVYYLEPLQGKPRAGALGWEYDLPGDSDVQLKELQVGNDAEILEVVSGFEPEQFVPRLLDYREYICKQGSIPPWIDPATTLAYSTSL